jgi:excinuclease ABC subunit A
LNGEIQVRGARQHNLRNIDVSIPRDKLTVITGVSGSGKSSLAVDVIYGEAQRRLLDSFAGTAGSFIRNAGRPDVDFISGLSPALAIDQRRPGINPRSTVGTMTDIYDYLRLLFASVGRPQCPSCSMPVPTKSVNQITEWILGLPEGADVELNAPVEKKYGETYRFLFDEIRGHGYNRVLIDGIEHHLGDEILLDESTDHDVTLLADRFIVNPARRKAVVQSVKQVTTAAGDGFLQIQLPAFPDSTAADFYRGFACPVHHTVMVKPEPGYFTFNSPESACRTCGGLGSCRRADPRLLVQYPSKSLNGGALIPKIHKPRSKSGLHSILIYSLSKHYGFSLDTPWNELPEQARKSILYGTGGEKILIQQPPDASAKNRLTGQRAVFGGFLNKIEKQYWSWSAQQSAGSRTGRGQELFGTVMLEEICPDCGGHRLKRSRSRVTVEDRNIFQLMDMQISDCLSFFMNGYSDPAADETAGPVLDQIINRLQCLCDLGLGYLNLGRRSDTLSGGEAQRIKISTQISSGLLGMIYVLDEPSIGLHARDNELIIRALKNLRDTGNTVITVEHDLQTIAAADHIIEMGPGAGLNGGSVTVTGSLESVKRSDLSATGRYLRGNSAIPVPEQRRKKSGKKLQIFGAAENNLKKLNITLPLGRLVCVTGVSGSGKSSLVHEIIYKGLKQRTNFRVIPGMYDRFSGDETITDVINMDQTPIGKSSRSNPATYTGLFDRIRKIFTEVNQAQEMGFSSSDFSFNSPDGGRCEECQGKGKVSTHLQFMADIETVCPVCRGKRYKEPILEVTWNGKDIADVLDLSVQEAEDFFTADRYIRGKCKVMNDLGLGYLKLGQSADTLSGGEAQRIKLAGELSKLKPGEHIMYILDEPTTGLHPADISKLLETLNCLIEKGHSVLVIEHHLDVIKCADYVIDLGPEGGSGGGHLVASGTPEELAVCSRSYTGRYLAQVLQLI